MSDKKVERPSRNSSAEHVQPSLVKPSSSSPEEPSFEAPRRADDKGKAALLERFRERDARFRSDPVSPDPAQPGGASQKGEPDLESEIAPAAGVEGDGEGGVT